MMTDGGGWTLEPVKTASELDAIAQGVQTNAANTIKALQDLGIGGGNAVNTSVNTPLAYGATAASANLDTGGDTVTNWRSGLTAKKGTALGDLFEKQNADRAIRDAAYANKPTEPAGEGYYWQWQERNQTWARIKATGFGAPAPSNGGVGGGGGGGGSVITTSTTSNAAVTPTVPTLARDVFKNTLALLLVKMKLANRGWMNCIQQYLSITRLALVRKNHLT